MLTSFCSFKHKYGQIALKNVVKSVSFVQIYEFCWIYDEFNLETDCGIFGYNYNVSRNRNYVYLSYKTG